VDAIRIFVAVVVAQSVGVTIEKIDTISVAGAGIVTQSVGITIFKVDAFNSVAGAGIVTQSDRGTTVKEDATTTAVTGVTPQLTVRHVVQEDTGFTWNCCAYQGAVLDDEIAGRVFNPNTVNTITINKPVGNEIGICFSTVCTIIHYTIIWRKTRVTNDYYWFTGFRNYSSRFPCREERRVL
jgi:hypothetical protein